MSRARTLACPASLKGALSARKAAAALAQGLREWSDVDVLPVADGGEGTLDILQPVLRAEWRQAKVHDAFGRPRRARWLQLPTGEAAVEAAEAIPLDPRRLDPIAASSRGLGELIRAVGRPTHLHVGLGGTANVDAGAGLLEVLDALTAPTSRGKAPGEVTRRCRNAGVRCVVFGGRVAAPLPGVETVPLSGEPARARADLVELGLRLCGLGAAA